jgi:hypothetical protein
MPGDTDGKGAIIEGSYRYRLWRRWEFTSFSGTACFVMLNPSTADAEQDDPRWWRVAELVRHRLDAAVAAGRAA